MAGITLQQAEKKLQAALDAEDAALKLEEWQHGGNRARKANLDAIGRRVEYWTNEVARLSSRRTGGMTFIRVRPV